MISIGPPKEISGEITVPGDKSISHRGLILASLANGRSTIKGLSPGADVQSTQRILSRLGTKIKNRRNEVVVRGTGLRGLRKPRKILDCGNSGTSARLMTGVLTAQSFTSVIDGDRSLRRRPMERVIIPLRHMGADIREMDSRNLLPLEISGRQLKGIHYELPVASAQVKTAILLAGLFADGETSVTEPIPTRDHTERLFRWLELPISRKGLTHSISSAEIPAFSLQVPGDFSSAAYFIALGLLHPNAEITINQINLNPTRAAFLDLLKRMGAHIRLDVTEDKPELVGDITVRSSHLKNQPVDVSEIPAMIDELPLLAVVATQAEGILEIQGAEELRVKESDRLQSIVPQLQRMGAKIEERPDGFVVEGGTPLSGSNLEAKGDHRIAMSLAIAASIAEGESELTGEKWVDISFPGFFDLLSDIGAAKL